MGEWPGFFGDDPGQAAVSLISIHQKGDL